jgi:hypothetical protein
MKDSPVASKTSGGSTLILEMASEERQSRFPAHGWALNPQGAKLLWLPINNLLQNVAGVRRAKGMVDRIAMDKPRSKTDEQTYYAYPVNPDDEPEKDRPVRLVPGPLSPVPLYTSLHEVALLLSEIHRLQRLQAAIPIVTKRDKDREMLRNMEQLAPMYIKWLYVEFRRLMDLVAIHFGRVAFANLSDLPNGFPRLRELVANRKKAMQKTPLVNVDKFLTILQSVDPWFEIIRRPEGNNRGVRDALLHANVRILVSRGQAGCDRPRLTAHLSSNQQLELISALPQITSGLCKLFRDLYELTSWRNGYTRRDYFHLWGNDDDITGFWPEI